MTKPRVTTADRLSNIIEVVELGRRSGLLTVERGSHQNFEQGEVYFLGGQAVYALVEGLRGRDALTVLAGWGQCRFAFEPNAPAPAAPNVAPPQPAPQPAPQTQRGHSAPSQRGGYAPQRAQATPPRSTPSGYNWEIPASRPLPEPQTPTSHPSSPLGPQAAPHTGALSGGLPGAPTPSAPFNSPSVPATPSSLGASWPAGSWPGAVNGQTPSGQLGWSTPGAAQPSAPSSVTGPFATSGPVDAQTLQRRPRRAPDVRDLMAVVNSYNLSRNHRTILLLADGEHTVLDLARLSSKAVEEVVALLADLERRGLVYYY